METVPGHFQPAIADLVEIEPNTYLLTRINVPTKLRGHGVGSLLLDKILAQADALGVTIVLEAHASGGMGNKNLVDWYKRRGFETQVLGTMARKPR